MIWEKSRKGFLTLKEKGQYLHSPYQPEKEADRFILQQNLVENNFVIFIEPLLGYCIDPLLSIIKKNGKLIILSLDKECHSFRTENFPQIIQYILFENSPDLSFLDLIDETNYDRVKIIYWPPVLNIYKENLLTLLNTIKERINQAALNRIHTLNLGRRKQLNILKKLHYPLDIYRLDKKIDGDIILIAPGPSLKKVQSELFKKGSDYTVASLSSALPFLKAAAIEPDIVFTQDGGYWASHHYCRQKPETLLVAPFSSYPGIENFGASFLPYHTGDMLSHILFPEIQTRLKEEGTVAITALKWLIEHSKGTIFLAGLDLSTEGILSHVRPYSLDDYLESQSSRLNSLDQIHYHRYLLSQKNNSLEIYRKWMQILINNCSREILSLTPTTLNVNYSKLPEGSKIRTSRIIPKKIDWIKNKKNRGNQLKIIIKDFLDQLPEHKFDIKCPEADLIYQLYPNEVMEYIHNEIDFAEFRQNIWEFFKADFCELLD